MIDIRSGDSLCQADVKDDRNQSDTYSGSTNRHKILQFCLQDGRQQDFIFDADDPVVRSSADVRMAAPGSGGSPGSGQTHS